MIPNEVLVNVKDLKMYCPVTRGLLRRKIADLKAVDGISFTIRKGETLGLVGESGCGRPGQPAFRLNVPRISGPEVFFPIDI